MKATKKIVGAACALVAAVALSAGTTFAWFSSNSQVNTTAMQVKASTTSNLYIKEGIVDSAASITGTQANLSNAISRLNPAVLSQNASAGVDIKYVNTEYDGGAWSVPPTVNTPGTPKAEAMVTAGVITKSTSSFTTTASYCNAQHTTVVRKSEDNNAKYTLTATLSASFDVVSQLNGCFRIGLLVNDVYYDSGELTFAENNLSASKTIAISEKFNDNSLYDITIILYFDGNDADCIANNAITLSTNSVTAIFNSVDAAS